MRTGWWCPLALRPAYSLLEVIVVVAILGTVVALTGPSVSRMVARQQVQDTVRAVNTELAALRVDAYVQKTDFTAEQVQSRIEGLLPEQWRVEVDPALKYRATGYCEGGDVSLIEPSQRRWRFRILTGTCAAQSALR